jgi:chromosome segregation ATPase
MTSHSNPVSGLGSDGFLELQSIDELLGTFGEQLVATEKATSRLRQLREALHQKLFSEDSSESIIEQLKQQINSLVQQLSQKEADLLEKEEIIKSKDVTCSTLAQEVQRLQSVLRQRSREYQFPYPEDDSVSVSTSQNNELPHTSDDQSTSGQIEGVVQPCPAERESIPPSTITSTATTSEMESVMSEFSSETSSVSSTSVESRQSYRSRNDIGPTAPPESLDSWSKDQLIARISSLQDDIRKVATINAKWKADYEEMKSNMQREIDRLAGALRHREENKRRLDDTKRTTVAVQEAIETIEKEKQTALRELDQLRSQLNTLKTELSGTQQQLDEVLSYKEQEEQAVETLKEQLRAALAALETNRGDCERLTNENSGLRGENVRLTRQVRLLDMKLIDIKRKLRDLMSDPETEETVQGPVIPPRDKTSQKITSKMKSKPTVNPDMLLKQLEKQTHVPGNHGQLPGSQKSTGKGVSGWFNLVRIVY